MGAGFVTEPGVMPNEKRIEERRTWVGRVRTQSDVCEPDLGLGSIRVQLCRRYRRTRLFVAGLSCVN